MSFNRIQKLLFSEYKDFEDMVLVESPFAQTTRDGDGIRQVNLGLTPTKFVIATDILPDADETNIFCDPQIDPITETLELVSIFPVDCVNISIFRRKKRQCLKAHFCNNHIVYYELGGFEKRRMFWNLWCERVRFLNPNDNKSSRSETSVATSTSASTLRMVASKYKVNENGKTQLWIEYGAGDNTTFLPVSEIEKHFEILPNDNENQNVISNNCKLEGTQSEDSGRTTSSCFETNSTVAESGIDVGAGDGNIKQSDSISQNLEDFKHISVTKLIESRRRHPRRYGLKPNSHFLYGFGPWNLYPADRYSVQRKRVSSDIRIRRHPDDLDLCLTISKRLLTATISCEAFHIGPNEKNNGYLNKLTLPKQPILYFWTPEYWYRPQTPQQAYVEFIQYLSKIRSNVEQSNRKKVKKPKWLRRRKKSGKEFTKIYDNSINFSRMKSVDNVNDTDCFLSAVQSIRQRMKSPVSKRALDFDSTCLAYELTMIDRDLFLKIEPYELESWTSYRSSKNIPNISTIIAFSHRISNLITTEILQEDNTKVSIRAKIIIRFINVANKCERLNNFHSCISVLNGLQSLPIYRLHGTWAYIRKYYSMKYILFETLCRLYNDSRLPKYQESFLRASHLTEPFLPSITDILARLTGKVFLCEKNIKKDDHYTLLQNNIAEYTKTIAQRKHKNQKQKTIHTMTNQRSYGAQKKLINFISTKVLKVKSAKKENSCRNQNTCVKSGKKILFPKSDEAEMIKNTIVFLKKCQKAATKYALSTDVTAREYLLKTRYQEDKYNFYHSFKLEPKLEPLIQ